MPAVVKLGGSTASHQELAVWIEALAGASLSLVIVPGGGLFADQVRDAQKRIGFSDDAAHVMALLAMEQFGQVILERHARFRPARTLEDMQRALAEGKIPVWLASTMVVTAPDIPATWDITSDSLAAWLAGRVGATAAAHQADGRVVGARRRARPDGKGDRGPVPRHHAAERHQPVPCGSASCSGRGAGTGGRDAAGHTHRILGAGREGGIAMRASVCFSRPAAVPRRS
jgi:Uncharacterized archaeal kinase related to aspartokinases, uridylate kinases